MTLLKTYLRALRMLSSEFWLTLGLVIANVAIGLILLVEPLLFGRVVDALSQHEAPLRLIGFWATLGLFSILASMMVAVAADRLAHRQRLAALGNAFEKAITLPLSKHSDMSSGRLMRNLLAGSDALFGLWLTFMREHLSALVSVAFLVPTAIMMQPQLASILCLLAALYAIANFIVVNRTSVGQARVEDVSQDLFGRVGDVLGNINVVQSFWRFNIEVSALRSLMSELLLAQYPVLTWWALLVVLTRAAATITMVAVFTLGAFLEQENKISVGEIVSFVGFSGLLIGKLDQLSNFVARLFNQAPTLDTFFELLDAQDTVLEVRSAKTLKIKNGKVEFSGVSYSFPGSTQGVFDLSFIASPGQTIALVGTTGSGKTTTLSLLQRLRDPDSGSISIDGQDIRDVTLASLRASISTVFQDSSLFNRSIAENIRIGRPDATDEEVREAARLAEALAFIEQKPGGFAFEIGERGARLSGGERQRLAIARAILKAAPILILDEATSALDTETEAKIQIALKSLCVGRTTFVIAHRLSTVAEADRILVLKEGLIIEEGRFEELVRLNGAFARMVKDGGFNQPEASA